MAFGINREELKHWKKQVAQGDIAFLTHYWFDKRFPQFNTVTKVAAPTFTVFRNGASPTILTRITFTIDFRIRTSISSVRNRPNCFANTSCTTIYSGLISAKSQAQIPPRWMGHISSPRTVPFAPAGAA